MGFRTPLTKIDVRALPGQPGRGRIFAGNLVLPCALGASGIRRNKREGDRATPAGAHALRRLWYRADRVGRPCSGLPVRAIKAVDGWCDSAADRNYNRPVRRPYPASHEAMRRDDQLYDWVVEIGWNDRPRIRGRGSAIFLHVAREGFAPTEGCVAVTPAAMRRLLPLLGPRTRIVIG